MSELRIRNWDRWQSYRKDRGQPPWIKIHRCVMRDPNWVELNDAQRGQLVAMWLLAADRDGAIPASPAIIKKLCFMDKEPDIKLFVDKGFIEPDANTAPERRQDDAPEERRGETEERREETDSPPNGEAVAEGDDPVSKAFFNYNVAAEEFGLPLARTLTPDRRRGLRARLKEHGLEGWNQALLRIEQTPFLRGGGSKGWRADLDFLLQPKSFNRVLEGAYDGNEAETH